MLDSVAWIRAGRRLTGALDGRQRRGYGGIADGMNGDLEPGAMHLVDQLVELVCGIWSKPKLSALPDTVR